MFASNFCVQPIDIALFIRFFRERYRLCWKEIYLKIACISRNNMPEQCSKCQQYFKLNDLATCQGKDGLTFHEITKSANNLSQAQIKSLMSQI